MSDCFVNKFGSTICYNNAWILWGRWVVLAGILALAFGIYLIFACISARRRHKAGVKPYMGTHWTLGLNPPPYNSSETLPNYSATINSSNNRHDVAGRDVEAQRTPKAADVPLE